MAGGGSVDDDEIGRPVPFEFLDLAEHEEVLEPWRRRGHHRERCRGGSPSQHATDTLEFEVVAERLVGRNRAPADLPGTLDPAQDPIVLVEFTTAEQRPHPRATVDGDEQHVGASSSGGERIRRGHRR